MLTNKFNDCPVLKIKNNNTISEDDIELSNNTEIIFNGIHKLQSIFKGNIDYCPNWDKYRKNRDCNIFNTRNNNNNIVYLDICSRAYLKFTEIVQKYNLCDSKQIKYLALAEAPGGFIEAFINYRIKDFSGRNDNIYTISLSDVVNKVPIYKLNNTHNFNIKFLSGIKQNGDLCDIENIKHIGITTKCNLISADGGIDFSKNYNNQEHSIYKLLLCECVTALTYNSTNGHFVLKIFDIHKQKTIELIYLMSIFYKEVILFKPYISRNSNSEKYLICKSFIGININILNKLYETIQNYDNHSSILKIRIPTNYIKTIYDYNKVLLYKQITDISHTILNMNHNYSDIIEKHIIWCLKYDIPINRKYLNNKLY